jgi:hypothetical protein
MGEQKSWRKILMRLPEHYLELVSVFEEARRNSPFIFFFNQGI